MRRLRITAWIATALVLAWAVARAADGSHVAISDAGTAEVDIGASAAHELSGITFAGPVEGEKDTYRYLAVSDNSRTLHTLKVGINPETGSIASCAVVSGVELAAGGDLEGVAFDGSAGTVFVCDEAGAAIREHALTASQNHKAGAVIREASLPPPFSKIQDNTGLESLGRDSGAQSLWTANEEALPVDGEKSTAEAGSVVRIVRLGPGMKPTGQWPYSTDPVGGNPPKNAKRERSGVVDIAPLPDGTLLVLERMLDVERFIFADIPHFRSRIYHVDLSAATDVSEFRQGLKGRKYTLATKKLLWEGKFSVEKPCNFEGMALGPSLADGSFSVLLISDDEKGALMSRVQALRLEFKGKAQKAP